MVENKLNIIMNHLIGIVQDLYVLKFPKFRVEANNGVGSVSSFAFENNFYIRKDEEMGDA